MIVILDSGVLHTLVTTSKVKEVTDCQNWFYYLLSRSALVVTSSICNYNVKHLNRFTEAKKWQDIEF